MIYVSINFFIFIFILKLDHHHHPSAASSVTRPLWPETPLYAQSSFYYADYKVPVTPKKFLPEIPNCPETGRTVCQEIEKYPIEEVFNIVQNAKARKFNFSSVFMDERDNDAEPNFEPPKRQYPQVQGKGYIVYQTALPVLPIRYVSQQNNRYGSRQHRQPTHQIVFPNPTADYGQQPTITEFQSPSPTQDYGLQPQTPSSSYGQQREETQRPQTLQLNSAQSSHGQTRYVSTENYYRSPQQKAPQAHHQQQYYQPTQSDPYNLPPPPPPAPPSSWKPMYPSSTTDTGYGDPGVTQEKISSRFKRQSEDSNEIEAICRTQKQFISPKVALNDRAEWKYIVNLGDRDPRLRQVIKVDVCSNANEPCSNQITLPFGFISRCKQKYIKKKLLSLDPDGEGTSSENFFVPSCCVCEIIRESKKKK